jgi:hypothetical protein
MTGSAMRSVGSDAIRMGPRPSGVPTHSSHWQRAEAARGDNFVEVKIASVPKAPHPRRKRAGHQSDRGHRNPVEEFARRIDSAHMERPNANRPVASVCGISRAHPGQRTTPAVRDMLKPRCGFSHSVGVIDRTASIPRHREVATSAQSVSDNLATSAVRENCSES